MSYCDSAIASNIALNCNSPLVAGFETKGIIINRKDIDFAQSVIADNKITNIVLVSGKKAFSIEQPSNNPFTGTTTTMNAGTYANTFDHNVGFVVLDNSPEVSKDVIDPLANGNYVIILENKTKGDAEAEFQVYGWHQGAKASEISEDKYSEDTNGGWLVSMAETKAPMSAVFFSKGTYAATKAAVESLLSTAQ